MALELGDQKELKPEGAGDCEKHLLMSHPHSRPFSRLERTLHIDGGGREDNIGASLNLHPVHDGDGLCGPAFAVGA